MRNTRKATKNFIERVTASKWPLWVNQVVLFGSEAYGAPRRNSDIDLAVVSENDIGIDRRCEIAELLEYLNPPYECQVAYCKLPEGKIFGRDVRRDIFEKGVVLYEK